MQKTLTLSHLLVNRGRCMALAMLLCAASMFAPSPARAIDDEGITIIADASLMQPLREITQQYARREAIGITIISDRRHYPVDRISEGLSADLVITSNAAAQADLQNMGLTDQFATRALAREPVLLMRSVITQSTDEPLSDIVFSPSADALAASTTPRLAVLNNPNYPALDYAAHDLGNAIFETTPIIIQATTPDELRATLQKANHFTVMPQSMRGQFPGVALVRMLDEKETQLVVRGDVLAGTRMAETRAVLAYLAGPDAAAIWRKFNYDPENY